MTEPDEAVTADRSPDTPAGLDVELVGDSTELSERNKEAEDVTQLSSRVRDQLANDPDEYTALSSRHMSADEDTADATRLSRRSAGKTPAATRRKPKLSALPPGAVGGAVAERGDFGKPAEEYVPRAAPMSAPPSWTRGAGAVDVGFRIPSRRARGAKRRGTAAHHDRDHRRRHCRGGDRRDHRHHRARRAAGLTHVSDRTSVSSTVVP